MSGKATLAPSCGLYCGVCLEYNKSSCHGCGCDCNNCEASGYDDKCAILKCAREKRIESCADCKEMPCSQLIRFCYDPVSRHHAPAIDNLRRRREIGTKAWLKEQSEIWNDDKYLKRWLWLQEENNLRSKRCAGSSSKNQR